MDVAPTLTQANTVLDALGSDAPDDRLFCTFVQSGKERAISYGDLREHAKRYAQFLQLNGVQPGEVVIIILRHSPDLIYSFLGAMLAGAVPSFMPPPTVKQDPGLYWSSHAKLFERIGRATLLVSSDDAAVIAARLPNLPLRPLTIEDALSLNGAFIAAPLRAESIAFLQHSSGTTGLKKGVALSHTAVLTQIASYSAALQLSPDDRIISWLPLYHDMGLIACFLLPLVTRTPVVMIDPFEWVVNPTLLFQAIKSHRATLCWQPNFAFHHLIRTVRPSAQLDVSSMRAWINCSEPCRGETFELFAKKFAPAGVSARQLQVCYAMAETVFAVTQTAPNRIPRALHFDPVLFQTSHRIVPVDLASHHQSALSAGTPIDGLNIRIVSDDNETLSDRHVGEICVSGQCLFAGYYLLPDETRQKLRGREYHTGDLGFVHEGELFITGRKNDLIIVHGRNYYAHEIEFMVNRVPGVHPGRAVAAGWFRSEVGSEDIVIVAESELESTAELEQLAQQIKRSLLSASGLTVFDVHLVPPGWLVKTTSGKLSRVENLNKYFAALSETQSAAAATA